jgi:hypothetical protein
MFRVSIILLFKNLSFTYEIMQKILFAFCALLLSTVAMAQNQTLNEVLKARQKGTGAIIKDNTVTGYFSFYELGKSKGKRNYQLNIMDQNLTLLSKKKFSDDDNLVAMEAVYNGQLIMLKFFNESENKYVLKAYDENAALVLSKTLSAKKVVNPFGEKTGKDEEAETRTIIPVEGFGFVHFVTRYERGFMSENYSDITFIPNAKDQKGWSWATPEKERDYEYGDVLGCDGKNLYCLLSKRKKWMSKDIEDFVLAIDLTTGTKVFEKPLEDDKHAVSALNSIIDPNGNLCIYGMYFEKDAKTAKESSLGLFNFVMSPKGEMTSRKYQSWETDIAKHLAVNSKGKIKDVGYLYFHKFIRTADNKVFAVGEQYKLNPGATAGSMAAKAGGALLGAMAGVQVSSSNGLVYKIEDLYVLEFNDQFDLKNVSVFDKTKSNVEVEILGGMRLVGVYMDYFNLFDYAFTQVGAKNNTFSIGYVDYSREKGDKGLYFGSISYNGSDLKTDKIKFEKKASWQHVYPAKPGYVMITEYYRKEKRLEYRLEKLNM